MVRYGMIERKDRGLIQYADDPAAALLLLQSAIRGCLRESTDTELFVDE
jgi:hypothetical protein